MRLLAWIVIGFIPAGKDAQCVFQSPGILSGSGSRRSISSEEKTMSDREVLPTLTHFRWSPKRSGQIILSLSLIILLWPADCPTITKIFSPVSQAQIEKIIQKHHAHPKLVKAIISVESGWRPFVVSSKGAVGLMQVKPESARMVGLKYNREDLRCVEKNIHSGTEILKYYQHRYSLRKALHYYSGGAKGYADKIFTIMNGGGDVKDKAKNRNGRAHKA